YNIWLLDQFNSIIQHNHLRDKTIFNKFQLSTAYNTKKKKHVHQNIKQRNNRIFITIFRYIDNAIINPLIMRYLKTKITLTPTTRVYTSSSFGTILGASEVYIRPFPQHILTLFCIINRAILKSYYVSSDHHLHAHISVYYLHNIKYVFLYQTYECISRVITYMLVLLQRNYIIV
ncbi:hypothetical protein AGLY_000076, partial [Aphis glycines]